ncbi:M28 family peptidase [Micromonospora sp. NBC_01813]|uniref:M28 family peptidase n=1 Tax=Micromonospora sp. NBC_01813 TaxID=2975988 RepID=UPI002DD928E0|nr:M28 family peptidase [Micromonospora sp. NBC_01813]WSA06563.1 M28 family peptidase [Micromonospora sp. NBC_01813]
MTKIDPAALRDHVVELTRHGPRHRDNPTAIGPVLDHLTGHLTDSGYRVAVERYGDAAHEVNLIADLGRPVDAPIVEVGAHWDTVAGTPGADDNASGVAGLLEIARLLAVDPPARSPRFCVFGGEEDDEPFTGSRAHVARLGADGVRVAGAVVLEMIAYRDSRPGTQRIPAEMRDALGDVAGLDRGDFVCAIGSIESTHWLAALQAAGWVQEPTLPVVPLPVPRQHSGDGARSDHVPYWAAGWPAVMVSDTANFRNPHYHRPSDTIDTLDFDFAAAVAATVAEAVRTLSR